MDNAQTDKLVIEQRHREAADAWKRDWQNCRGEHTALVQAFAHFERDHLTRPSPVVDGALDDLPSTETMVPRTAYNRLYNEFDKKCRALNAALAMRPAPETTASDDALTNRAAWNWLEQMVSATCDEEPSGLDYSANQMISAFLAGAARGRREVNAAAQDASNAGYKEAWQEIADLLGIPAQPTSPRHVHEEQVMPILRAALQKGATR